MKKRNIFSFSVIAAILIFTTVSSAQEKPKTMMHPSNMKEMLDSTKSHKNMMHNHEEMSDSAKHGSKMHDKMHNMKSEKVSIIREGIIELSKIDINKDGKVYQDQMCWNVISDEAGKCPQCNMKLKEVSIEDAKKNLTKNGYKSIK